jgi:uncharacterized protein YjbJ (UPF0337 family)
MKRDAESTARRRHRAMPDSMKDLNGRAKEAAGDLTDDGNLKREGKVEQAGEKVKHGVDEAADKVKEALHRG